jgi:hypothetical protein
MVQVPDDDASSPSLLEGVSNLLDECRRDDTAVIALVEQESINQGWISCTKKYPYLHVIPITSPPPNPKDLWTAIHEKIPPIQPKGFGGSSGFGIKAADPERAPLPRHCVVLCSTENQCRAARYCGMRVVCRTDNALADAVVDDWSSLYMDDIATPGSYWLNPPHPRDDNSNAVDVEVVILAYGDAVVGGGSDENQPIVLPTAFSDEDLSDAELAKMLADIDPL